MPQVVPVSPDCIGSVFRCEGLAVTVYASGMFRPKAYPQPSAERRAAAPGRASGCWTHSWAQERTRGVEVCVVQGVAIMIGE